MLPFIYIFGIQISSYLLMMIIASFISFLVFFLISKKDLSKEDILFFYLFIIIGGILGAKILAIVVAFPIFIKNNVPFIEYITHSGMVFYGGVVGAFLMGTLYIKSFRLNPNIWDKVAVILPVGHAIGRIGCFLAGCCYGIESSFLGVLFPHSLDPHMPNTEVLPTQLFESLFCFILFILLLNVYKKHSSKVYFTTFLYCVLYSSFRFFIEFFRGDISRGIFILSTSQYISIALAIFGVLLYFTKLKTNRLFYSK